ncbi:MAG: hypothetical protein ACPKOP_03995 [Sphaerochaetaceae bacterium]
MFIQFETIDSANAWLAHNDALVGYTGEGKTKTLSQPTEGADGFWYVSLATERWDAEGLAEPLELLDGVIVESFERIQEEVL